MRILVIEDDFASRRLLQRILSPFGETDVAVVGEEGINAFINAINEKQPYDLICLDIMLPKMDGQEVLKKIREIEIENGIGGFDGVKILMTTALGDAKNIMNAFKSGCEAYLIKPIIKEKVLDELKKLNLIN
ncbi:MAG: response regulator [Spirochaetes bacterium]|nr:response regulator [Spirochaetota bacterium]